jgi:hypothetical protein
MSSSEDYWKNFDRPGSHLSGASTMVPTKVWCNGTPIPRAALKPQNYSDGSLLFFEHPPASPRPYHTELFSHSEGYKPPTSATPAVSVKDTQTASKPDQSLVSKAPSVQNNTVNPSSGPSVAPALSTDTRNTGKRPTRDNVSGYELTDLTIDSNFRYPELDGKRRCRARTQSKDS